MQLIFGFLLAVTIAYLSFRVRALDPSGALAATALGTLVFGLGGWQWAVLLLLFFLTSTALSRSFSKRKTSLNEKYEKGDRRDAGQVFGNGGLAAVFLLVHLRFPESNVGWMGFAASLAAVNADTWATELGILNATSPRLITDLKKRVEKGTSGGVSFAGTTASLMGAAVIALPASLFTENWIMFPAITAAGLAGSLFDSFLGATVQAMYYCPVDRKETEKHPLHTCGTLTTHLRGWKWLGNDWVNFLCSAFGVLTAFILLH